MSLKIFFVLLLLCFAPFVSFSQKLEEFQNEHNVNSEGSGLITMLEKNVCMIILSIALLLAFFLGFYIAKECTLIKPSKENAPLNSQ
jgi:hypothetical protein